MPPRHAYWTILIDDQPTAFRAHDAEELLPTLNRLREKNASAVMKWFERGKLFDSRDQARDVGLGQGERRWEGPRPERDDERPRSKEAGREASRAPRDKHWRPGGEHRDPRQKYKDAKKAKWNRFKDKIRERHDERGARGSESFTPPHGDKLRQPAGWSDERRPSRDRRPEWRDDRGDRAKGPRDPRPREPWRPGPSAKPHGDKFGARPPRADWRRDDERRSGETRSGVERERNWSDRPPRRDRDQSQRPWSDRPPRRESDRDRGPWNDRPPRHQGTGGGGRSARAREDSPGWRPKGPGADRKPGGSGRKPWSGNAAGGRKPWNAKPGGEKKPWHPKPQGRPAAGRPPKRRRDDE